MSKYIKHGRAKLWAVLTVIAATLFVGSAIAQDSATVSVAIDSAAKVVPAVTEVVEAAVIEATEPSAIESIADLAKSLDTVWVLLGAMLVFFMQPGFALVEAGMTRSKNMANILMKNFVDFSFGSLLFWFVGFGLMFGVGDFVGMPHLFDFASIEESLGLDIPVEAFLVFQTVFCATSATIVSGAMAERTKFSMYMIYTIFICVLIYPVSGHWTWGGGWLMNGDEGSFMMDTFGITFHDFAGSTRSEEHTSELQSHS